MARWDATRRPAAEVPGLGGSRGTPAEAWSSRKGFVLRFFPPNPAPVPIWPGKQARLPFWMELNRIRLLLFKNRARPLFCFREVGWFKIF